MKFRIKSLNNLLPIVNTICMQLISTIMGISFGQADIYRRAIEKKKKFPEKFKEFEDNFVKKGMENKFSEKICKYVQQQILDNAGYSFNSSHRYVWHRF